jgi:hypothetical protein
VSSNDEKVAEFFDSAFTQENTSNLAPGVYVTVPQGHALVVDENRNAVICDLGGEVTIAGVRVTDWDALRRLGEHLTWLAGRKKYPPRPDR